MTEQPDSTPSKQHGDPLLTSSRDEDRGEPGSRQGVDVESGSASGDGTGEGESTPGA